MQGFFEKAIAHLSVLAITGTLSVAHDLKPYPGSKLDVKVGQEASSIAKGMDCHVYTTDDSFDKVYGFYKALYKEVVVPFPRPKLSGGKDVKWAFFVLDEGKDLSHSNYWMKIQQPYIGTADDSADFEDVRDVSVIQTVRKQVAKPTGRERN